MTKNNFLSKRLACLLTTTALLTTSLSNVAHSTNYTLGANDAWGDAATISGTGTTIDNPVAGDNVNIVTFTLTVADEEGVAVNLGAVTGTTGTLTVAPVIGAARTVTIGSINLSGASDAIVNLSTLDDAGGARTFTVTNGLTALTLNQVTAQVTAATATTSNIGGTVAIGGVTSITATKTGGAAAVDNTANFSGASVTFTGGVVLNDDVGKATLGVTGAVDQTIAGAFEGAAVSEGTVLVNNTAGKKATFTGAIGDAVKTLVEVKVNDGKTAEFQGAIKAENLTLGSSATGGSVVTLVNNGHIIGTPSGTAGVVTIQAGTILNIGRGVVAGETLITGLTLDGAATGVVVGGASTINLPSNFSTGTITLIDTATNLTVSTAELAFLVPTNTPLTTFAVAHADTTADVSVTATAKSDATTASELGVNTNKATGLRAAVLSAATQGTDTTLIDAFTTVLNAGTTTDTAMANQVAPQTDTIVGSTVAAKAVTSGVQNVISTRLASLRSGDAYSTGVVTGSGMSANSGFIQAFGSKVEQKNKGNEFGYDADTTGFAIGFDGKVDGGAIIGISYAHADADVDGKGTGRAKNDIKTDSVSLYADYATKDGYVEGSITYGKSDNKGSRIINTEGLDRTYTSNYDSEQYSFRLSGGIPQSLGGGAFFTPFAAATISQIKADAYTESSTTANDALRLRVAQDTVDSQVGTVGVKFHQAIKDGKTTFTPEVKLAVNQEFGDDNITTTNTYQGGGASFKNSTAIEKTSATAGVGLNISSDNVSFNIGYEADVRDKYLGHSAQAKITAKF